MKLENYKQYEIHVDNNGRFNALQDGKNIFNAETLKELKEQINIESKNHVRRECIVREGYGDISSFKDGTLTSITEDKSGYGRKHEAWVSFTGRDRGKFCLVSVFKPTPENRKIIAEINSIKEKVDKLKDQASQLFHKLETFSEKDFGFLKEG